MAGTTAADSDGAGADLGVVQVPAAEAPAPSRVVQVALPAVLQTVERAKKPFADLASQLSHITLRLAHSSPVAALLIYRVYHRVRLLPWIWLFRHNWI